MFILNGGNGQKPQKPQPNAALLAKVFCIGITLGSGLGYGFKQATDLMPPCKSTSTLLTLSEKQNLGLVEYIKLEPGMTLAQVESILDRGVEIQRSETTMTYIWTNANGSNITVLFKNKKLENKNQFNLK